jgi:hypothetical protein
VWLDLNGDGKQTPDEMGISGVSVDLLTSGPDGLFGTADQKEGMAAFVEKRAGVWTGK